MEKDKDNTRSKLINKYLKFMPHTIISYQGIQGFLIVMKNERINNLVQNLFCIACYLPKYQNCQIINN